MKWRHATVLNLIVLKKENIVGVLLINTTMYSNLVRKHYFITSKFCPIKNKIKIIKKLNHHTAYTVLRFTILYSTIINLNENHIKFEA